jgi:hypothetical protein
LLHPHIRFLFGEFYVRPTGVQHHVTVAVISHTNSGTGPFPNALVPFDRWSLLFMLLIPSFFSAFKSGGVTLPRRIIVGHRMTTIAGLHHRHHRHGALTGANTQPSNANVQTAAASNAQPSQSTTQQTSTSSGTSTSTSSQTSAQVAQSTGSDQHTVDVKA